MVVWLFGSLYAGFEKNDFDMNMFKVNVFTGIANVEPLIDHLKLRSKDVIQSEFKDHHSFKPSDILRVISKFKEIISSDKILITTEKDAMRLKDERLFPLLEEFPVFYLPIEIKFHKTNEGKLSFDQTIIDHVQ